MKMIQIPTDMLAAHGKAPEMPQTVLPRAVQVITAALPALGSDGGWGTVTLVHADRHRRRIRMLTDDGRPFLLDLREATRLADGDRLMLDQGGHVVVRAAPEAVIEAETTDRRDLARIAWHLGNRHVPVAVTTHIVTPRLRLARDLVARDLLGRLGAHLIESEAPFDPEPILGAASAVAWTGGRHDVREHGHEHEHGHGAEHGHEHGHDHARDAGLKATAVVDLVGGTGADTARAAWQIGNRHRPVQIVDGWRLRAHDEPLVRRIAAALGLRVTPAADGFDPEQGAYADHAQHH
ncbi:hypothetical protein GCM10011505_20340 [Tistrella bauzanensis]|uniref:Urease accessory protein UreE n=1 Tax=Tistrella bauzanensis TaxID=657419 RepID=A0ABQ1IH19_9PROT|nr:hypothetical protein [Tistrella bauzanensis]GGB38700.1 hypothetical protein GCM10011505_20340 [Tistrella bauzanensis]